ncbi:MAG: hypothetical protein ACYCU0_09555 [Solirubrobacteraceae bacterium]
MKLFKDAVEHEDATIMHERLEACPVRRVDPPGPQILECRVVTIDARLRRGTAQMGIVIGVDELMQEHAEKTTRSASEPASKDQSSAQTRSSAAGDHQPHE